MDSVCSSNTVSELKGSPSDFGLVVFIKERCSDFGLCKVLEDAQHGKR